MAVNLIWKRALRGLLVLSFLPLLCWESGWAEMVKAVSVGTTYDNNAYGSYAEEADYITRVNLYLAHRGQGERSQIEYYYLGNGSIFAQSGTRSFTTHRLGVVYFRQIGEGRNRLFASGSFSFRKDRSYYDVYDYIGGQGAVNGKWYIQRTVMLRLGYRLRLRNYWNLDQYSYAEHDLSTRVSKFLPTRTTLRAEIGYGYKNHRNSTQKTAGFGTFQQGRRRTPIVITEPGVPDEGQFVLAFQAAQSLAANTGLSLWYQRRLNAPSERDGLYGEDLGYSDDEGLFDDRYDYDGYEWSARLTQQLPGRSRLVFEGGYETRRYDRRLALNVWNQAIASGAFRSDRTTFGSVFFEMPLATRVDAGIWYVYERNRSNDLYYDYSGRHSFSINLEIGL